MRIAVCYYGLVGGASGNDGKGYPISPKIGHHYYKKHLFDKNENIDTFIHSWSIEHQEELISLYNPVSVEFEKQIQFKPWKLIPGQIFHLRKLLPIMAENYLKFFNYLYTLSFRAQSRWYSNKRVLDLVTEYEKKVGFSYDYVFITRLDVAFFSDLKFSNYDPSYFYVGHRNQGVDFPSKFEWKGNTDKHDDVYNDLWYFSNSKNMKSFSTLYDNLKKYSIRPPLAGKQHIDKITRKVKKVFFYGIDYHPIRNFFYGKPY